MAQQPPQGGQYNPPQQVFCPQCRGGNAPAAWRCQWCGQPLQPAVAPQNQPPGYPPQPPVSPQYPPAGPPVPPQVAARRGLKPLNLLLFGVLGICLCFFAAVIFRGPADRGATTGTSRAPEAVAQLTQVSSPAITPTVSDGVVAANPDQPLATPAIELPSATPEPPTSIPPSPSPVPPSPTLTPMPSFGDTQQIIEWDVSLAKMEQRDTIVWSQFGNAFGPSGKLWVVWLDLKNNKNESRSVYTTLIVKMIDDRGAEYDDASGGEMYAMEEFAKLEGRTTLRANIAPRSLAHPIFVFDVAADALPAQLVVAESGLFASDKIVFNLKAGDTYE